MNLLCQDGMISISGATALGQKWTLRHQHPGRVSWRSVTALDQLHGSFGQQLRLDVEMNCSKDFTLRLRLWSTVRWNALNIEFSNQ